MRLRSRQSSFIAMAAAVAVLAPMAPASAAPSVTGEYATVTPTVLTHLKSDDCRDAAQLKFTADLIGIGNAVQAQGYTNYQKDQPVYTALEWGTTVRITGPNNYFHSGTTYTREFPTSEVLYTFSFCPEDYGTDVVTPGVYTVETTLTVDGDYTDICGGPEKACLTYPKIYEKASTFTISLDYSPECYAARALVPSLAAKLKTARSALKKAKATHNRPLIRKKKRAMLKAKARLQTAQSNVKGLC
ncbi:MAG: hypothetical protein ABIR39_15545 [Nocardioides sp.]|uniref:hypothetical protein n=1 Tax=Nocardioides sp. TaxID=35761 RepID=UPI003265973F